MQASLSIDPSGIIQVAVPGRFNNHVLPLAKAIRTRFLSHALHIDPGQFSDLKSIPPETPLSYELALQGLEKANKFADENVDFELWLNHEKTESELYIFVGKNRKYVTEYMRLPFRIQCEGEGHIAFDFPRLELDPISGFSYIERITQINREVLKLAVSMRAITPAEYAALDVYSVNFEFANLDKWDAVTACLCEIAYNHVSVVPPTSPNGFKFVGLTPEPRPEVPELF